MAIKALWYLSMADGNYPWMPEGFYPVDFQRYKQLAQTIDRGGFFGALVATWPNDPLISASSVAPFTEKMKFLVAEYAGLTPAKLLAQQALTFEKFYGSRLLFNHINGTPQRISTYGVTLTPETRYALGKSYWNEFQQYYHQGNPSLFPNTDFKIEPTTTAGIQLWGTGDSVAGIDHAGQVVNVYLLMMRELNRVKAQFSRAVTAAQKNGRIFNDLGALTSITVRKSQLEAEQQFYQIFQKTGIDLLKQKLDISIQRKTNGQQSLKNFQAPDQQRQEWIQYLRQDKLPPLESLRLEKNLFAGISAWSSLDIFGYASSAAYLVGSPENIASTVETYHKEAGLTALIMSGWPLIEEAEYTSTLLLPLLKEIA
ncbi:MULTISPECIES: LLM class flavin-dependent oxidoreductase [unclassified Acinetobacter]|uniref:LLM class flavin-dependent oxidoreductase n=1 Tax=unclassified Acinetobacter TaxID=196816 RepID=UPI0029343052|nr:MULTISPECIES: LLM class flavin-dependent oxidoreductase [unclassified Acinetobacter]WOE32469.1 LLM class flavin-dependent oxidoreductase [Acinetobacter sp. SAAs470]WOE37945.1 LLM class flavin-dependent oxidoreductase [Acinetobacter sp. SAAs474]